MAEQVRAGGQPQVSAVPWILEYLYTYPGSHELPLRTMYTLNSGSHSRSGSQVTALVGNAFLSSSASSNNTTAPTIAAQKLKASLLSQIAQQTCQPASLPPCFVTTFLRKCFLPDVAHVDFAQALTALDYLKDLEIRRRKEMIAALGYFGVNQEYIGDRRYLSNRHPQLYQWIEAMNGREEKVETLYSHVYLGLRRWILINEMSLTPFDKQNCMAMLNTLFPPTITSPDFVQPTKQLTLHILQEQHKGFFKYILSVEKRGKGVLQSLMNQSRRPGEENGWTKTHEDLENYMKLATSMINECLDITRQVMTPSNALFPQQPIAGQDGHKRKPDSGISFGSSNYTSNRSSAHSHSTRPSVGSSIHQHSRDSSTENYKKALPATPWADSDDQETIRPATTTLERIARELRRRSSKVELQTDQSTYSNTTQTAQTGAHPDTTTLSAPGVPSRSIRLKQSFKNLRSSSRNRASSASRSEHRRDHSEESDGTRFDPVEMRRQRALYEARRRS